MTRFEKGHKYIGRNAEVWTVVRRPENTSRMTIESARSIKTVQVCLATSPMEQPYEYVQMSSDQEDILYSKSEHYGK